MTPLERLLVKKALINFMSDFVLSPLVALFIILLFALLLFPYVLLTLLTWIIYLFNNKKFEDTFPYSLGETIMFRSFPSETS
jgi:hypothetical protein